MDLVEKKQPLSTMTKVVSFLEQGTGVEPAFTAWEAVVLPIYEPCRMRGYYSRGALKKQPFFVDAFLHFFKIRSLQNGKYLL